MKRTLVFGALSVIASLAGCRPSFDPATKADVEARVARLRHSSAVIPAPALDEIESMPLKPGQWTEYLITTGRWGRAFVKEKVLAEEEGAYWIEIVSDDFEGHTVEQLLVALGDRRDPHTVELRAEKMKNQKGQVTTLSATQLRTARRTWRIPSYWAYAEHVSLVIEWRGNPQESIAVAAGRFDGCYRYQKEMSVGRESWTERHWSHPSVPLGGLVRSESYKGFVAELVAYGTGGARSEF